MFSLLLMISQEAACPLSGLVWFSFVQWTFFMTEVEKPLTLIYRWFEHGTVYCFCFQLLLYKTFFVNEQDAAFLTQFYRNFHSDIPMIEISRPFKMSYVATFLLTLFLKWTWYSEFCWSLDFTDDDGLVMVHFWKKTKTNYDAWLAAVYQT